MIMQKWIKELTEKGFDKTQLIDALLDGQACGELMSDGYTQKDIEDTYKFLKW